MQYMVAAHVVFSPCPFRAAALDFLCACCYWILFISLCCDFPFDLFDRPGTFSHCTPPDTPTLPLFNSFHCNWLLKHKLFLLLFRFHWTNSSVFLLLLSCCLHSSLMRFLHFLPLQEQIQQKNWKTTTKGRTSKECFCIRHACAFIFFWLSGI